MTTMTSAALHKPSIKVEEADRPVTTVLYTSRLSGERIKTSRCVGCGEQTKLEYKRMTFWREGAASTFARGGIFAMSFVAFLFAFTFLLSLTGAHGRFSILFVFAISAALVGFVARLSLQVAIPHLRVAFARCRPCHRRLDTGSLMCIGVAILSVAVVVATSASILTDLNFFGSMRSAARFLSVISGVLVVLWLSPIFKAGRRRHVIVKKVTALEVHLQTPPTFQSVLRLEHPELFLKTS